MILFGWRETLRRLPALLFGLYIFGAGIAVMVEAGLGLGPWDVFHQGVSRLTGMTIGRIINITGFVVLLGFIPLREKLGLGTILNTIIIGVSADLTSDLLPTLESMPIRVLAMASGPALIALGSGFYIGAGLGPGPRDGIMTGLAKRGIDVWKARFGIEFVVLLAGLAMGGSIGVGTVWFTLGIGPMVQFFLKRLAIDQR